MSVLIKGMEMPKKEVRAFTIVFSDGKAAISCEPFEWHEVIPVPPHGRLIDADAAKESLKPKDSISCYKTEWTWGELYERDCVKIDKLPTIIQAEEGET